jgi:hypothetical protein
MKDAGFLLWGCVVLFWGRISLAQAGAKLMIVLLPSPECWDYRWCHPSHMAYVVIFDGELIFKWVLLSDSIWVPWNVTV